jgi:hypothetical protein
MKYDKNVYLCHHLPQYNFNQLTDLQETCHEIATGTNMEVAQTAELWQSRVAPQRHMVTFCLTKDFRKKSFGGETP